MIIDESVKNNAGGIFEDDQDESIKKILDDNEIVKPMFAL